MSTDRAFSESGPRGSEGSPPLRVLVVDDSAFMRKMVAQILNAEPGIEVAGTARDGKEGLEKASALRPDVITLDVEMPNMDGLAFLEALMSERPTPVVMISSVTAEGADTTLACLQRGAVDFLHKPSGAISLNIADCSQEIVAKVRAAASARVRPYRSHAVETPRPVETTHTVETPRPPEMRSLLASPPTPRVEMASAPRAMNAETVLVAIATSTGGPAALHELLPMLPADLNAAYLIVQHLPAGFTRSLAERLNRFSALAVREAAAGDLPEPGLVLMAPGGFHMTLDARGHIALDEDPPLWGVRPAADVLMRSVATRFGKQAIGVVLTGMGRDGALGAKAIASAGGLCLAQDEATCVVYGMPHAACDAGGVTETVALHDMSAALIKWINAPRRGARHQAA